MTYADPRDPNIQNQIIKYYQEGFPIKTIVKHLNLKYHQPIYALVHRLGIYKYQPGHIRKYNFDQRFFSVIDTEEKAYALGFIVADGSVNNKTRRVVIQVHRKDRDVLEKIASALNGNLEVKDITHTGNPHAKLSLNSAVLIKDLGDLGVYERKSLTMDASVFSHVPDSLKRHFLRGYFDGDGHVTLGATYSSGVKYIIDIIGTKAFLEGTFGKMCKTNCKLAKYKTCDMWHWRTASKQGVVDFLHYIYDDSSIYLARKFEYFQDWLKTECAHTKPGELLEP